MDVGFLSTVFVHPVVNKGRIRIARPVAEGTLALMQAYHLLPLHKNHPAKIAVLCRGEKKDRTPA
jgi:hypothetical protein